MNKWWGWKWLYIPEIEEWDQWKRLRIRHFLALIEQIWFLSAIIELAGCDVVNRIGLSNQIPRLHFHFNPDKFCFIPNTHKLTCLNIFKNKNYVHFEIYINIMHISTRNSSRTLNLCKIIKIKYNNQAKL